MKAWEQKFKKERKENVRYFKNIEAENNDLKGKLWDLRNRSRQGNLHFDGASMKMISGLIQKKMWRSSFVGWTCKE